MPEYLQGIYRSCHGAYRTWITTVYWINMNIKYIGPAKDYSGYGEAVRHDIAALVSAGVEVTTEIPKYTLEISDFGELGDIAVSRENKPLDYKTIILHTTPNVYRRYMEPNKYHIGRVFWETDKLPEEFAINCRLMQEIWTGSQANADAIKKAGITCPIFIIPEAIDTSVDIEKIKPYIVENESFNMGYKFYSMFEWTERKNPTALLTAYFQEFKPDENVSLTIKTYIDNFTPDKKAQIREYIGMLKHRLSLTKLPKFYLLMNLMDRSQVYRFHKTFDCFISAHRGEGWGIPQMEAMLLNKPVISTNYGGIHEYLTRYDNALLVKYDMIPLRGNTRNKEWYCEDQNWADVNVTELRQFMRATFENQKEATEMGKRAGILVRDKFNVKTVGEMMKNRLETIYK